MDALAKVLVTAVKAVQSGQTTYEQIIDRLTAWDGCIYETEEGPLEERVRAFLEDDWYEEEI